MSGSADKCVYDQSVECGMDCANCPVIGTQNGLNVPDIVWPFDDLNFVDWGWLSG